MGFYATINLPIANHEVPDLRELIGWGRRDYEYPTLFERCNFWAGVRNENGELIAFGYVTGMGLEHGYLEDVMIHPSYQKRGIGIELVQELLRESERFGIGIVTVTFDQEHSSFYQKCGFTGSSGGVWMTDE